MDVVLPSLSLSESPAMYAGAGREDRKASFRLWVGVGWLELNPTWWVDVDCRHRDNSPDSMDLKK